MVLPDVNYMRDLCSFIAWMENHETSCENYGQQSLTAELFHQLTFIQDFLYKLKDRSFTRNKNCNFTSFAL